MKTRLVRGFLVAVVLATGVQAHAWEATAVDSSYESHIAYNMSSPEEAQLEALKLCNDSGHSGCQLAGKPKDKMAVVVARGDDGYGGSANPDPMTAAREALAGCSQRTTHCRISAAAWDEGTTWTASAESKSPEYMSVGHGNTQEDAQATALDSCRKHTRAAANSCALFGKTLTGHLFLVFAHGPKGFGLRAAAAKEGASQSAIEGCATVNGGDKSSCKIDPKDVIEVGIPAPAPESMKKIVAIAEQK